MELLRWLSGLAVIRRYLKDRKNKSLEMLEEYTDIGIVEYNPEIEEREKFLVEDNHFVGATATFADNRIIPTDAILPYRYPI